MKHLLPVSALIVLLWGCMVGPDYRPPLVDIPVEYSEDAPCQTCCIDDEDFFQWWKLFEDPLLDALLEEAIGGSFGYQIALEQVRQAKSQYWVQFTQILPELDADAQASRFRTSQSFAAAQATPAPSPIRNFFQMGFDVIWEIDLFGGLRRSARSSYDAWQAADEEARAVKIVVLSEVANTYALIRSYQNETLLAAQVVSVDEALYGLSKSRFEAGLANEQEVQAALVTLENDRSNLLAFETVFKLNVYSLATLLGRLPESLWCDFQTIGPVPFACGAVPAGLPSDLLRRRPDIRAAERNLASATEQIGVAVAELFPKVALTGSSSSFAANPLQGANLGYSSDKASRLLHSASRVWGIGSLVTFPVFDWGERLVGVDIQKSLARQAYLSYQKSVIAALEEVEQALAAYFNDERRVEALGKAAESYRRDFDLASDLYQSGLADYTQMLAAKDAWLNAVVALTDVQALLTTDIIAVYKSLGGDW